MEFTKLSSLRSVPSLVIWYINIIEEEACDEFECQKSLSHY